MTEERIDTVNGNPLPEHHFDEQGNRLGVIAAEKRRRELLTPEERQAELRRGPGLDEETDD